MAAPINRLESMWPRSERSEVLARHEAATWSKKAKRAEDTLEDLLMKHPRIAIAAAAAVGIALGWIVKRR
jgi:ElaB/YqjD/DUF883 family membrane-anchored ribosome-binding protein